MTMPFDRSASASASADLPLAVGPAIRMASGLDMNASVARMERSEIRGVSAAAHSLGEFNRCSAQSAGNQMREVLGLSPDFS